MGAKGIIVRQTGDRILFRESLKDSSGSIVTTGTTSLRIFELQSDATLKEYDFNDNTFKTGSLTTSTASMTHRTTQGSSYSTGLWTYALTTVSGFTAGGIYIYSVGNTAATPPSIEREFQYGSAEGDLSVTSGYLASDVLAISSDSTSATRLKNLFTVTVQGTVDNATFSPTTTAFETSIVVNSDKYTGQALYFVSGNNAGYTTGITAYAFTNSKVKFTVNTLPNAPANTDIFLVFGKIS